MIVIGINGITLVEQHTGHTLNQMVCCHRVVTDKKLISGSNV